MINKNKNIIARLLISILTVLCSVSCSEINTNNPKETYEYWSGTDVTPDLKILSGHYWQSSRLTREYIMYLKFKSDNKWWNKFIEQNQISIDKGDWQMPSNAPKWFNPSESSVRFSRKNDLDEGSRYFKDTLAGSYFIYEIQL